MIGWRGASRYYSDAYKEAFGLECKAIKKVREVMGETKIRSRSQIQRRLEDLSVFPKNAAHCEALAWVLGEREELP